MVRREKECLKKDYFSSVCLQRDGVIKIKFVKLRDLSRYSEKTTFKMPTCQKLAFRGKLYLRY